MISIKYRLKENPKAEKEYIDTVSKIVYNAVSREKIDDGVDVESTIKEFINHLSVFANEKNRNDLQEQLEGILTCSEFSILRLKDNEYYEQIKNDVNNSIAEFQNNTENSVENNIWLKFWLTMEAETLRNIKTLVHLWYIHRTLQSTNEKSVLIRTINLSCINHIIDSNCKTDADARYNQLFRLFRDNYKNFYANDLNKWIV